MSGELKGFDAGLYLSEKEMTHLDPFVQYAVAASFMRQKMQDCKSGLGVRSHSLPGGVIIGSSRGGITTIEREYGKNIRITYHASRITPFPLPDAFNKRKYGVVLCCAEARD